MSTVDLGIFFLYAAHPFIKSFESVVECRNQEEAERVASGGRLAAQEQRPELDPGVEPIVVHVASFFVGLKINSKKLDIAWPCNDFLELVRAWDLYDESKMNIHITHLRRCCL